MNINYSAKSDENGSINFGKIICFDIDGVILKNNGYNGNDVFGEVIEGAVEVMNKLKDEGWNIILFTSRLASNKLINYLRNLNIPFTDINGISNGHLSDKSGEYTYSQEYDSVIVQFAPYTSNRYWVHNPPYTSIKPIASVYVDDMDWRQNGRNFTKETWEELYRSLQSRIFHV